ncbi:hypothetical protein ACO0SA_004077 [Hanseniaspora valbyensis]
MQRIPKIPRTIADVQKSYKATPPAQINKQFRQRSFLEVFRLALCIAAPITVMYYVGTDTKEKFADYDFFPDNQHTVTNLPKSKLEIELELTKLKKERLERRLALQERLINEFGVEDFEAEKERILNKK